MSDPEPADDIPSGAPGLERAVLAGAAALAGAFWAAPLFGVPVVAAALGATGCFAAGLLLLVRELGGRRQRRAAAREILTALRLSRRRFKLLADHSADMIVEADRDLVRRFVSPASLSLLGYRPDELVGQVAMEIIHPDDVAPFRAAIAGLLDGTRERVVTTQRYRRKDGSLVWTESHIQATRDPVSGAPDGYVGALRDVTDRHLADVAVRSSEAFLRGIIDASPDCLKVLDLDGQLTFMSRNGVCLLDFERQDQAVGRDFASLWPPDPRPAVRSAIAAAAAGASSRFRARCTSARGRPLHLDVVIAPILGADGRPERLLALSRDVSASTEAEEALGRMQDRYRLLAENSSDVVVLREPGPDGAVLYVSPSAQRVLGYTPEAIVDGGLTSLLHPDDAAGLRDLLRDLRPDDGIVLHTHRLLRADGAILWVEGAFHVAERTGEPTVVVALRDVTERRQRAEDLAAAKEVAERAQRSAEQASEAKSDFLAAMSHEIRTPLNSIIGFTDLMIDSGSLPGGAAHQAELIRAAGAALLTVVNDVLDFSKAEAGAIELEALPFSPEALAQQGAAILRGYAGTKAIDIEVEIGDGLPSWLVGDEARLRQVLLNLLNNAVKFTPRGGRVVLRAACRGAAAPTSRGMAVTFEVTDNGIGIAADKQDRLFERFSQLDSSVSRRFGGSGLGLAICKRLVELMGGSIGVTSREGEGSTFWFTVTLPAAAAQPVPQAAAAPAPGIVRPARILLAEDIDINQRLAVALLEAAGHAVDVVADGAQAVAAVAAVAYDLVLMDVQMPGMDGVTATRRIRAADGPRSRVPIVAMTANVFPEQVRAFRDAGMDDHLGKPLNRAQLYAAVDRWAREGAARSVGPDLPSFDDAAYDQLGAYLGPARLDDVLARLAASLPGRFAAGPAASPDDAARWKADAHVVLSVAGMTGFADLAGRCRALEAATPETAEHAACLSAVQAARDAAVARVADLRAALASRRGAEHAA